MESYQNNSEDLSQEIPSLDIQRICSLDRTYQSKISQLESLTNEMQAHKRTLDQWNDSSRDSSAFREYQELYESLEQQVEEISASVENIELELEVAYRQINILLEVVQGDHNPPVMAPHDLERFWQTVNFACDQLLALFNEDQKWIVSIVIAQHWTRNNENVDVFAEEDDENTIVIEDHLDSYGQVIQRKMEYLMSRGNFEEAYNFGKGIYGNQWKEFVSDESCSLLIPEGENKRVSENLIRALVYSNQWKAARDLGTWLLAKISSQSTFFTDNYGSVATFGEDENIQLEPESMAQVWGKNLVGGIYMDQALRDSSLTEEEVQDCLNEAEKLFRDSWETARVQLERIVENYPGINSNFSREEILGEDTFQSSNLQESANRLSTVNVNPWGIFQDAVLHPGASSYLANWVAKNSVYTNSDFAIAYQRFSAITALQEVHHSKSQGNREEVQIRVDPDRKFMEEVMAIQTADNDQSTVWTGGWFFGFSCTLLDAARQSVVSDEGYRKYLARAHQGIGDEESGSSWDTMVFDLAEIEYPLAFQAEIGVVWTFLREIEGQIPTSRDLDYLRELLNPIRLDESLHYRVVVPPNVEMSLIQGLHVFSGIPLVDDLQPQLVSFRRACEWIVFNLPENVYQEPVNLVN